MFKIFLTNLGKYNEGELVGKWLELPCDDITAELESIGVKANSRYEEYFITDYENEVGYEVGEYESLEKLNELAEKLEDLDEYDAAKLKAYIEIEGDDIVEVLESKSFEYSTFYPDMDLEDVARELVDSNFFGRVSSILARYINYDAIAHDLSCEGYYEVSNGTIYIE